MTFAHKQAGHHILFIFEMLIDRLFRDFAIFADFIHRCFFKAEAV